MTQDELRQLIKPHHNKTKVAEAISMDKGNFHHFLKGRRGLPEKYIKKFLEVVGENKKEVFFPKEERTAVCPHCGSSDLNTKSAFIEKCETCFRFWKAN